MFSGLTLTNKSGNLLGTHQKIDRISRKALSMMLKNNATFPDKKLILHFEGKNGPDGMKVKTLTNKGHVSHYLDPFDPGSSNLISGMMEHWTNLAKALEQKSNERAAFEAAWLAHFVVDGLTPPHHFSYEEELDAMYKQAKIPPKTGAKQLIIPGKKIGDKIANNWQFWGAKGTGITHAMFEMGSAAIIRPQPSRIAIPSRYNIKLVQHLGFKDYYKRVAREVALLDIHDAFYQKGWNRKVTKLIKKELAPRMAQTVTIAWYTAAQKAGLVIK